MSRLTSTNLDEIWQCCLEAVYSGRQIPTEFMLLPTADRISTLRKAFATSKSAVGAALQIMRHLPSDEQLELFDQMVHFSLSHSFAQFVRELILQLPQEWVLSHIEEEANSHLTDGTDDEYRRLLELYILLDHDLTARLVQRALNHPDGDVRETGKDFQTLLLSPQ